MDDRDVGAALDPGTLVCRREQRRKSWKDAGLGALWTAGPDDYRDVGAAVRRQLASLQDGRCQAPGCREQAAGSEVDRRVHDPRAVAPEEEIGAGGRDAHRRGPIIARTEGDFARIAPGAGI